jgi:hypothetical protein
MDDVTIGPWPAHMLGPSGLFEQTRLDALQMLKMLDQRLHELAAPSGYSGKAFGKWLGALRSLASAIIFHAGEVVAESAAPLTTIIVTEEPGKGILIAGTQESACAGAMEVGLVSIAEFMALIRPGKGGSALRPFLSSELLVLGARNDVEMMEAFFKALRETFESRFEDDLVSLVCADVKKDVFRDGPGLPGPGTEGPVLLEETDYTGKKPVKRRVIEEREFERIAFRAMRRRRVPAGIQGLILPRLKAAAGNGN